MKVRKTMHYYDRIVQETKLMIIMNILNDVHNYDNRFDVTHIVDMHDIIKVISETSISEVFLENTKELIEHDMYHAKKSEHNYLTKDQNTTMMIKVTNILNMINETRIKQDLDQLSFVEIVSILSNNNKALLNEIFDNAKAYHIEVE